MECEESTTDRRKCVEMNQTLMAQKKAKIRFAVRTQSVSSANGDARSENKSDRTVIELPYSHEAPSTVFFFVSRYLLRHLAWSVDLVRGATPHRGKGKKAIRRGLRALDSPSIYCDCLSSSETPVSVAFAPISIDKL